ncbi:heavy metal-associated isoprenylated plant protein 27-like [Panicum virgatum]|uniref:heavy metal-associated isoprenylated plant protein 27-like n=1 Tax=Panicum virgatum TaxID=38727 RepID=UPI0019D67364|nr:heavy metal-associated isoprenylated plant protein 27-like [Panicum virgatum]
MILVDDLIAELCELPAKVIVGKKKRKEFQKVDLLVRMDCEGCERRVRKALEDMKEPSGRPLAGVPAGVCSVEVDPKQNKVTVSGQVEPPEVVKRLRRRAGKKAEPWPYVPYEVVPHPYAPGAYDKKTPPGYVRNVLDDPDKSPLVRASSMEERYTAAFSDDNPNSCAVL